MSQEPMVPPHEPTNPPPAGHPPTPQQYPVPYQQPMGYPPQPHQQASGYPGQPYQQPMYPAQPGGYMPQPYGAVAPKNPGLALLASFFIPGLGSLINGKVGLGIAIFICYVIALATMLVVIGFVLVPAVWVWGMCDAYTGAKNWNRRHGILS
jgi:TM2 domain-containing membrane protein YozV